MTDLKKLCVAGLLALTVAGCAGSPAAKGVLPTGVNYGPAVSVPQVEMAPNGDRVGHYPPYYYPDGTSGGERP